MEKMLISESEMSAIIERVAFQILEKCPDNTKTCLIGIKRRGAVVAERLQSFIKNSKKIDLPIGSIDITLYRDDLTEVAAFPNVYGTEIPFDVHGKDIILVDDVMYTGRTVRAALDVILDYGRPAKIIMVALVDRGHRELPIQPDIIGKIIPTAKKELVKVRVKEIDGTDSVSIVIKD